MAKPKNSDENRPVDSFHFSLIGLIIFSLFLMAGTAIVSGRIYKATSKEYSFANNVIPDPDMQDKDRFTRKGPWGELLTQNIKLQRPLEYLAMEKTPGPECWDFNGLTSRQITALLVTNGLTIEQAGSQITPSHISVLDATTVVTPDENFLMSLKPETRHKLYGGLYGMGVGAYVDYPFIFPEDSIESVYNDPRLDPEDVAMLKRLVYPAANAVQLTDYQLLMRNIPTSQRRINMTQVLTQQMAVLAGICIRPDSDIDKIAAYWGSVDNVRFTDIRPMLEALKGLPHGGTMNLMFFLPPFARSRLYTYPLPPQPGDPVMDCHWTTFNFSSIEPDNRFASPSYAVDYINKNYYRIESPSHYGDIVVYTNGKDEIKHSAVFLADDLCFTKYGNDYRQPWMIVRLSDMQAIYPTLNVMYFRRNVD